MSRKKKRTSITSRKPPAPSTRKGRLLEDIAAWLHEGPGIRVETRVRLPISSGKGRGREIDVLLSLNAAGYPIRIAIECRNRDKVGAPDIDGFVGKLKHVGIPTQLGVFISAGGYTADAIERANEAGIRALALDGLTPDGLAGQLVNTLESVVCLVAQLGSVSVASEAGNSSQPWHLVLFWNESGEICVSVPELAWRQWSAGLVPDVLGTHTQQLRVPKGWRLLIDGVETSIHGITVDLHVRALVMSFRGKARRYFLRPLTAEADAKLGVQFEPITIGPMPLEVIATEDDLKTRLHVAERVRIVHRIRVPRIVVGGLYFPPSQASMDRYLQIVRAGGAPSLVDVEGPDIGAAFFLHQR